MKNLILVSGDIIENSNKYNVEVIVNTANKYMDYGGGVCGAIYNKVGIDKLETYCHSKWTKDIEVNEIRITTGFSLCKDIIHIYCPRYYEEQQINNENVSHILLRFMLYEIWLFSLKNKN